MIVKADSITGFDPSRPGANVEGFINHLLRGTANGMPGLKSSTVTGDYRQSSFSSERSADNDAWPEMESVQEWFCCSFCTAVYERVIEAGVLAGFFDGVITPEEFLDQKQDLLPVEWQCPVALSINPTDDVAADKDAIAGGFSSVQIACAKRGRQD